MSPVRPVRFFVTHVVAVCLIAGSLVPPVVIAEIGPGGLPGTVAADGSASPLSRKCWCGTPDGRCCGKFCCATPIPVPVPQAPLREPPQPRPDLLSLTAAAWHGSAVVPCTPSARPDSDREFLTSAFPSLQQAAVRINI
jgi:hypothetical protein